MITLINLEGTNRKETKAIFIKKAFQVKKITPELAVTSAGDNGAINIWLDDDNHFRCNAMRYLKSVDMQTYSDIHKVKVWAKKWLSEIRVS